MVIKETIKIIPSILDYLKHHDLMKEKELKRIDNQKERKYLETAEYAEKENLPIVADYLRKKATIIHKTSK